jgi:hypothetical protein
LHWSLCEMMIIIIKKLPWIKTGRMPVWKSKPSRHSIKKSCSAWYWVVQGIAWLDDGPGLLLDATWTRRLSRCCCSCRITGWSAPSFSTSIR